jgi:hypothetical protein
MADLRARTAARAGCGLLLLLLVAGAAGEPPAAGASGTSSIVPSAGPVSLPNGIGDVDPEGAPGAAVLLLHSELATLSGMP